MLPGVTREGLLISSRFPVKNTFISFPTGTSHKCLRETLSEGEDPRVGNGRDFRRGGEETRNAAAPVVGEDLHSEPGWPNYWQGWSVMSRRQAPLGSSTLPPLCSPGVPHPAVPLRPIVPVNVGVSASTRWTNAEPNHYHRLSTLNPDAPEFVPRSKPTASALGETASP
eukprot:Gregarina_sp_Pseudo_9__98@NODE_1065_length_1910_cov_10_547301_g997_i0_p2_GENE_NODE_1065_length_1910_cov_10_547301_g997_i0NODE_1065_length_1910_cov_10_547301_g997_i0_p2_ORF_typecomplete_len169_score4_87PAM2/PF07145_15/1_4e07_NODE_1065_length_1910_cov_10_547301_g997_i098604